MHVARKKHRRKVVARKKHRRKIVGRKKHRRKVVLRSLIQCIRAVFFPGQVRHRFQQVPCLDTRGAEAALSNEPFTVTCS